MWPFQIAKSKFDISPSQFPTPVSLLILQKIISIEGLTEYIIKTYISVHL